MKFNELTHGKFKYTPTGNVSTVFKRDFDSITIKRHDGWLVTVFKGDWSWDREVVVV